MKKFVEVYSELDLFGKIFIGILLLIFIYSIIGVIYYTLSDLIHYISTLISLN